jgi:hypothetical protein
LAQLSFRSHLPFDVAAGCRQQRFESSLGRFLIEAVLGISLRGVEGFFQKRHPDARSSAHVA